MLASIVCFAAADINVCSDATTGLFLQDFDDPTGSSYIVCMNGLAYSNQKCENGFKFNAANQMCSYASEVDTDFCPPEAGFFVYNTAYPSLCSKYILCYGTTPVVRECAAGLQFDSVSQRCNEASLVDCVANKCDADDDVTNIKYVQSASSCSK